jgi:hypothetical protein
MQRARGLARGSTTAQDRVAASAATRSTPLTVVSGAVAGDGLEWVAASVADALGRPVAVAIPALGEPVIEPLGSVAPDRMTAIVEHAVATISGAAQEPPADLAHTVPVRIGPEVVGILAVVRVAGGDELQTDHHAWLEAGATAAAVTALMRDAPGAGLVGSRRALVSALRAGRPADVTAVVDHARRLGFDLSLGAVAICAIPGPAAPSARLAAALAGHQVLFAEVGDGRLCGLVPLASPTAAEDSNLESDAGALAGELAAAGMLVAVSGARRDPAALHEAIREAELLLELATSPEAALDGQEETYRLLIGVLLRSEEELELLRSGTVSSLAEYDSRHDTDLLATLQAFLAHDGSTTETAEALQLHRHTVGYRLARAHEVSGLSPYESDGRERLSLGLKAHHIFEANRRLRE